MNHFDPELPDETRRARERFIDNREKQLQSGAMEAVDSTIKFLFLTNSGGALALLAYMGSVASLETISSSLKVSLAFFFFGVVLIGIYRAYTVHIRLDIFIHFQKITKEYFNNASDWDAYFTEMEAKVKPSNIGYVLGYGSFLCFLVGSGIGVAGLFQ